MECSQILPMQDVGRVLNGDCDKVDAGTKRLSRKAVKSLFGEDL